MAEIAVIAPDVDDALRVLARAVYLHQEFARGWFVGLPPATLLLACVIYVIFIAAPIAELKLPLEIQNLLTSETGYIALASTIASMVIQHNLRK
jgi:hypothetical protein